jgi:hypothetical protein
MNPRFNLLLATLALTLTATLRAAESYDLVTTNYGVYNTGGIAANPLYQTASGLYYINPQKLTLSTTVNF